MVGVLLSVATMSSFEIENDFLSLIILLPFSTSSVASSSMSSSSSPLPASSCLDTSGSGRVAQVPVRISRESCAVRS